MATNAGTIKPTPDYTDDPLPWESQTGQPGQQGAQVAGVPPGQGPPTEPTQPIIPYFRTHPFPQNPVDPTALISALPTAGLLTGLGEAVTAGKSALPIIPRIAKGVIGQQTGRYIGGALGGLAGPWGRTIGQAIGGWVGGGFGAGGEQPGATTVEEQAESLRPPQGAALGQLPVPQLPVQEPTYLPPEQESIVPQQFPRGVPAQAGAGTGSAGAGAAPRAEAAQSGPGLKIPGAGEQQQPLGTIQTPSARPRLTASDVALIDKFRRGDELSTEEQLTLSNRLVQLLGREKAQQVWSQYLSNVKRMGGAQTK